MIPAWHHCPSQWTLEYTGYLMTEGYDFSKATYECVDKDAQSVPGNLVIINGGFLCHVEASCNGLYIMFIIMALRKSLPVLCASSQQLCTFKLQ